MKDIDMTKEQLIEELAKLRQKNIELELALKDQDRIPTASELPSSSWWFSTGRPELYASYISEQEPSLSSPAKYKFSDLVDLSFLQQLLNSFYLATGIPYGLLDGDGNILSMIGWQDICVEFHRNCPQTECRCRQSDSYIAAHLHDGPYIGYKCLNGLMDFAAPIIVEGQHLATIFLGQILHELPDEDFFRQQAQAFGFDEAAYMKALGRVPIIPEEKVDSIMRFYSQLGQLLATMGLERKRHLEVAEQVIREQQERMNLIWATSNDGFWDYNIETGELYYSPRWADMLGYSLEEFETHFHMWKKLLHPEDVSSSLKALSDYLKGRTAKFEVEYRLLTKSGEWKWFVVSGQVVARNSEGQPLRMVGTGYNSTERKKIEAALLQSEQKFYKAFQCNPEVMAISTLNEGRYVEVNEVFIELIGYERDETLGRTVQDLGIWADHEERERLLKQIRKYGSIRDLEVELRLKSGEIRTFCLSAEIIEIDGEAHLLSACRDITESKRIQEQIRLSEECFAKVFNASPVVMALTTLDEGRVIKVNDAFCRTLDYSREEIIDQTILRQGIWASLADRRLVQESIMARQSIRDMEITFCKKSGEQRLGLYSAEILDINGEKCMLSVVVDITEHRKMEGEMTRLDRLNLVGRIAASIGHEIRNPMTTVRGYLQILRENEAYNQERDYFDLMIEELDRANSIITEFLSLAKNKLVERSPENLNTIITRLLPLIQAKAMSRDQYIKLELGDVPDLLLDKKEIRQLILNLVDNGLEAMPSAGEVIIRTFMENEKVVLAVKDQGCGIDHELLDKLGTPFLTTKEQGTGLGLAVCYRIVNRHNAKIDVDTGLTGSTFYVSLPLSE